MQFNKTNKITLTVDQALELIKILDKKRANVLNKYMSVMMCLKCDNNNDMFNVWNEFFKYNIAYDFKNALKIWDDYLPCENIYNYNLLLLNAKKDNETAYKYYIEKNDIFNKGEPKEENISGEQITVDTPYLLPNKKIAKCKVSGALIQFLNNNIKHIAIKSAYDTGKTTLLKELCANYKRIIFISYRVTLSQDISGSFKSHNFELYDENITAPRLICQIDSLYKLPSLNYDLVIMDESESCLNHINSSTIYYKESVLKMMTILCASNKAILLDGDLGERSKIFLESLGGTYKIINNVNRKNSKHFIFHKNEVLFNEKMDNTLKENKNIVIVSMSEKNSKYYYELYKDKYKTILYTGKSDDKQKKDLKNVCNIWLQYQIIIYSPCIESGVNFDIPHIDNCFGILCSGSTSQRGFCQMLNRVRKLSDCNININLNNIPCNIETNEYTIKEIEAYYNNANDYYNSDTLTFVKIQNHNKLEEINKQPALFLPIFIKMISDKGNTYAFEDDKIKTVKKLNMNLEQLLRASEIANDEQLEALTIKQQTRNASETDKFQLLKYYYEKTFKIKFNLENKEQAEIFFNRIHIVENMNRLTGYYNSDELSRKVEEIIKMYCGGDVNDVKNGVNCLLNKEGINNKIDLFDEYFKTHKVFFNIDKKCEIKTVRALLGKLNSVLSNFGMSVIVPNKNKPTYVINILDEIKPLMKVKNEVSKFVDINEELDGFIN